MPFAPFIFLICLVAGIAYLIYVKRKERELIEQVTPITRGEWSERRVVLKLLKAGINPKAIFHDLYIQKPNGTYTQVDVAVATKVGLIVFEVKDYSGWIFGNEKYKMWTQTLPQGKGRPSKKEKFLNPIMQNKLHIRCLNEYLKEEYPVYSVIAFSQRCELKKIELVSDNAAVVKRNDILKVLAKNSKYVGQLDEKTISEIYDKLYPLTQVSEEVKKQHIENIKKETENENFGN